MHLSVTVDRAKWTSHCPNVSQVAALPDGQPDKEAILALYLKGWTPQEIADHFKMQVRRIHKWVVRGGWAKLKSNERQNTGAPAEDSQRAERLRSGIAQEQERDLAVIKAKTPRTLREAREREELLNLMARSVDTLFPSERITKTDITVRDLYHPATWTEPRAIDVQSTHLPEIESAAGTQANAAPLPDPGPQASMDRRD